jgi:RHS repeat-associated protein
MPKAQPFDHLGYYHCDHLGTPQEITDEEGNIAWQAQYTAWGEAKEVISKAASKAGFKNPLRFQGQYFDHETGLHYNRFRYYDPEIGRFISKDPISLKGGMNLYQYSPNPTQWIDPNGLCSTALNKALGGVTGDNMQAHHLIPEEVWGRHEPFLNQIGLAGKRDVAENGLLMPDNAAKAKQMKKKFYHCGSHAKYSGLVDRQVFDIEHDFHNGTISASEAKEKISALQKRLKVGLSMPGKQTRRLS